MQLGKLYASMQNLIQIFLLISRFSDVITHTLLLQMNHVAAFNVCQKFHTLMTFHWARTRIAQKCASGGDRITTVHGNHFSHRPRARAVIGQWKIVVTECMLCEWKMNHLVLHVRSFDYVFKWWNNWISKIQNFKSNLSISMLSLYYHCM